MSGWSSVQSVMTVVINLHENIVEDLRLLETRLNRQHDQLCIHCIERMLNDIMRRADDTCEAIQVKRFYSGRPEHQRCRETTDLDSAPAPTTIPATTTTTTTATSEEITNPASLEVASSVASTVPSASALSSVPPIEAPATIPIPVKTEPTTLPNLEKETVLRHGGTSAQPRVGAREDSSSQTVIYLEDDRQRDFEGLLVPKSTPSSRANDSGIHDDLPESEARRDSVKRERIDVAEVKHMARRVDRGSATVDHRLLAPLVKSEVPWGRPSMGSAVYGSELSSDVAVFDDATSDFAGVSRSVSLSADTPMDLSRRSSLSEKEDSLHEIVSGAGFTFDKLAGSIRALGNDQMEGGKPGHLAHAAAKDGPDHGGKNATEGSLSQECLNQGLSPIQEVHSDPEEREASNPLLRDDSISLPPRDDGDENRVKTEFQSTLDVNRPCSEISAAPPTLEPEFDQSSSHHGDNHAVSQATDREPEVEDSKYVSARLLLDFAHANLSTFVQDAVPQENQESTSLPGADAILEPPSGPAESPLKELTGSGSLCPLNQALLTTETSVRGHELGHEKELEADSAGLIHSKESGSKKTDPAINVHSDEMKRAPEKERSDRSAVSCVPRKDLSSSEPRITSVPEEVSKSTDLIPEKPSTSSNENAPSCISTTATATSTTEVVASKSVVSGKVSKDQLESQGDASGPFVSTSSNLTDTVPFITTNVSGPTTLPNKTYSVSAFQPKFVPTSKTVTAPSMTPLHLMISSSLQPIPPPPVTSGASFAQLTQALSELSHKSSRENGILKLGPIRDPVPASRSVEDQGLMDDDAEDVFLGLTARGAVSRSNFLPRTLSLKTVTVSTGKRTGGRASMERQMEISPPVKPESLVETPTSDSVDQPRRPAKRTASISELPPPISFQPPLRVSTPSPSTPLTRAKSRVQLGGDPGPRFVSSTSAKTPRVVGAKSLAPKTRSACAKKSVTSTQPLVKMPTVRPTPNSVSLTMDLGRNTAVLPSATSSGTNPVVSSSAASTSVPGPSSVTQSSPEKITVETVISPTSDRSSGFANGLSKTAITTSTTPSPSIHPMTRAFVKLLESARQMVQESEGSSPESFVGLKEPRMSLIHEASLPPPDSTSLRGRTTRRSSTVTSSASSSSVSFGSTSSQGEEPNSSTDATERSGDRGT